MPIGGRIKSAAVGLAHLHRTDDLVRLDAELRLVRKKPLDDLLAAFFPRERGELRQMMEGIGFYRPTLKTDQGMAGNFLPFHINTDIAISDLFVRRIVCEEGLAIPEPWFAHEAEAVRRVQESFLTMDFSATSEALGGLVGRVADKGRFPFFFIRPAKLDRPIIFGQDVIVSVTRAVAEQIASIEAEARELEERAGRLVPWSSNLLYCQPDVYILTDGTVQVEKINCPDLGLFLGELEHPTSTIISEVQQIVAGIRNEIVSKIASLGHRRIAVMTRDEVIERKEDILEQKEIAAFRRGLAEYGISVEVYAVSSVADIPAGSAVVLLNVDYRDPATAGIIERHVRGELGFYPNPFVQMVCQRATGLRTQIVPQVHRERFLQLAGSYPSGPDGLIDTLGRLDRGLFKSGITNNLLHAVVGGETIPLFRRGMHSWQQFTKRARRHEQGEIAIREIPATPENLIVTSATGPRLHVFRFTVLL